MIFHSQENRELIFGQQLLLLAFCAMGTMRSAPYGYNSSLIPWAKIKLTLFYRKNIIWIQDAAVEQRSAEWTSCKIMGSGFMGTLLHTAFLRDRRPHLIQNARGGLRVASGILLFKFP